MPRQRFLNLAPEARARLLGVAARHFAKQGFERASLNEILTEVGISKGAYYYYFDDKDDLFATTLESAVGAALERFPMPELGALTPAEFWPTVEHLVHAWAASVDSSSELVQLAAQLSDTQRKSQRFAPLLEKAHALYRILIQTGQRLGCVRTDLPVTVLVRLLEANDAVLDGLLLAKRQKITRGVLDKHVRLVFDTFKRLLEADVSRDARLTRSGGRS